MTSTTITNAGTRRSPVAEDAGRSVAVTTGDADGPGLDNGTDAAPSGIEAGAALAVAAG